MGAGMPSTLKRGVQNAALVICVLVFLCLLAEVAANILVNAGIGRANQIAGQKANNIVVSSPNADLGYLYRPNIREPERNIVTNSAGFREYEWTASELARSRVILNIGDSITFGMNVRDIDDVYGKVVQSLLSRNHGTDGRYVVYNAGIGGYNTWQEEALLRHLTGKIRYDMVILGLCLNDSSPKLYVSEDAKGAVISIPARIESVRDVFSRKFLGRSKAYVMFKELIKSTQRRFPKMFPSSVLWHNLLVKEGDWISLKQTLRKMRGDLEADKIPFIVVIFPYEHQLQLTKKDNIVQNDLMAFCQSNSIHCLDLFDSFGQNRHLIHWDQEGVHPDGKGHLIAGQAIYEYLVANQLIPISPAGLNVTHPQRDWR